MSEPRAIGGTPRPPARWRGGALNRFIANPDFQRWAARFPLTRRFVRRDGEALFELVAGFCHSQVLMALVELEVPELLLGGRMQVPALARHCRVPEARMAVLLRAGAALGLLRIGRLEDVALTRRGAALAGVPGLGAMVRHHRVLYGDLADPVAFFRGERTPELAAFWPYVFGAAQVEEPGVARRYSSLMAESQRLVADDTLDAVSLRGVRHLADIGGGTGVFLAEAARRWPALRLTLVDLPAVVAAVDAGDSCWGGRLSVVPESFRDAPLPQGADAISLVRVLYDHGDDTVRDLLAAVHAALPPGGLLIVSEPMAGGATPCRSGDTYFALYTLAMQTGRARAVEEIASLCADAGFCNIRMPAPRRAFVTRILTARSAKIPGTVRFS